MSFEAAGVGGCLAMSFYSRPNQRGEPGAVHARSVWCEGQGTSVMKARTLPRTLLFSYDCPAQGLVPSTLRRGLLRLSLTYGSSRAVLPGNNRGSQRLGPCRRGGIALPGYARERRFRVPNNLRGFQWSVRTFLSCGASSLVKRGKASLSGRWQSVEEV